MSNTYPGGLIRKTPPTITPPVDGEGGSAPGVWTLEQATNYIKQGAWPLPTLPRYLYSWGLGSYGATGLNNTTTLSSPVQVGALTNWQLVSGNNYFSAAIKNDGTLWTWGINEVGNLGHNDVVYKSSPVQVGALTNWSIAATGFQPRCMVATKTDGTLWSWGDNVYGNLGINSVGDYKSSPVQIGALTTWATVSANAGFCHAIKTDGTLWGWGRNNNGQVGDGTVVYRSSPVQIGALTTWSKVTDGAGMAFAIKTDGTLWAWGLGNGGRLGTGNSASQSSPVQIGALTNWSKISARSFAISVKTDGTLWAWGDNSRGQLGQNNLIYRSSPVQIGALTTWSEINANGESSNAIKTDGTLWTWGRNNSGQLGVNDIVDRSSPVQVGSGTNWYKVGGNYQTVLAIIRG